MQQANNNVAAAAYRTYLFQTGIRRFDGRRHSIFFQRSSGTLASKSFSFDCISLSVCFILFIPFAGTCHNSLIRFCNHFFARVSCERDVLSVIPSISPISLWL